MLFNKKQNKYEKQILFVFLCVVLLISCHPSKKEYLRTFDLPLMKQTEKFCLLGNLNAGISLNKQYLMIADKEKYEPGKATCYTNLALLNYYKGNYKNSLLFLQKADSILKNSDDMIHKAHLYNQYGMLNLLLLMGDIGHQYFDKSLYCLKKSEDSETKQYLLQLVYINKSKVQGDSSLIYVHKARDIKKNVATEGMIAALHFQKNELDSTQIYLNNGIEIANKEGFPNGNHGLLYLIAGMYYQKMHQYKNSEEAYQKSLKNFVATKETFGKNIQWIYLDLANLYNETGDQKREHQFRDLFYKEKEKFEEDRAKTANLSTKTFIAAIKNEEKEGKNRIWLFIILSGILIIFISFFVFRNLKRLQIKKKFHFMNCNS
ncbi:hypothetical protein [Chryseobacterium gossypii]|uniref:hypothetical protein n=1 Tax=Chryseobacterium gossypii TaxID=3231602 RepID=UPI00352386C1